MILIKNNKMYINSWACELVGKPVPTHLYELPLGILIKVQEAGNQSYLRIPDFKVVAVLGTTTATI